MPGHGHFSMCWECFGGHAGFLGTPVHLQWKHFHPVLIQSNAARLFAGPSHLSTPEVLVPVLQHATELSEGMCEPKARCVFAKFLQEGEKG